MRLIEQKMQGTAESAAVSRARKKKQGFAVLILGDFEHVVFDGRQEVSDRNGELACRRTFLSRVQLRHAHHQIEHNGKGYDVTWMVEVWHVQARLIGIARHTTWMPHCKINCI